MKIMMQESYYTPENSPFSDHGLDYSQRYCVSFTPSIPPIDAVLDLCIRRPQTPPSPSPPKVAKTIITPPRDQSPVIPIKITKYATEFKTEEDQKCNIENTVHSSTNIKEVKTLHNYSVCRDNMYFSDKEVIDDKSQYFKERNLLSSRKNDVSYLPHFNNYHFCNSLDNFKNYENNNTVCAEKFINNEKLSDQDDVSKAKITKHDSDETSSTTSADSSGIFPDTTLKHPLSVISPSLNLKCSLRPFKAYPKEPIAMLPKAASSFQEMRLHKQSYDAYNEFRKQMLDQINKSNSSNPKMRRNMDSGSLNPEPDSGKDATYWERRKKNNEAAKRSRDARRAKEDEIAIRAAFLEHENTKLKIECASLREEVAVLKSMIK